MALFTRDGDAYAPAEDTRSPWSDDAQHGGAAAALIGRELESVPSAAPMNVVRCTVEILRPIPLEPLRVRTRVEREGRRVQLLAAQLTSVAGDELCLARAWRVRAAELGAAVPEPSGVPFALPEEATPHVPESEVPAFHRTGVELRFARGTFHEPGPVAVWIRLLHDVVEGETPSPLMRVLAAADFGNGVSSAVEWGRYIFINTDLSVYLHRAPAGEWVALEAETSLSRSGCGLAESRLYDRTGPLGRSLQALLLDALPQSRS